MILSNTGHQRNGPVHIFGLRGWQKTGSLRIQFAGDEQNVFSALTKCMASLFDNFPPLNIIAGKTPLSLSGQTLQNTN